MNPPTLRITAYGHDDGKPGELEFGEKNQRTNERRMDEKNNDRIYLYFYKHNYCVDESNFWLTIFGEFSGSVFRSSGTFSEDGTAVR